MKTIELSQGSPEWVAHRAKHYNASEAAAMLGISPYVTRSELVRQLATGIVPEVDSPTQRRFDDGHAYEAEARPWAEEIIGEELYPVTVAEDMGGLPLSASLDGLTMAGEVTFEHKMMNEALERALADGKIPEEYHPQLEQGLMLSGASKCLFMASRGAKRTERHAWYESNPELRARILRGWKQLREDVAAYKPEPVAATVTGRAPSALPALRIQVTGAVTQSNLPEFKARAIEVFRSIKTDLQTDEDFADAEQTVKFCKNVEERLEAAKQHALSQTATIDELFRAIDEIGAEARAKRLELDKSVKSRKETIRLEIIRNGEQAFREHVATINQRLGKAVLPLIPANFAGVIKGLKTLASIKDAVATELARAKIEANAVAEKIDANLRTLREHGAGFESMFPDVQQLVVKDTGDLVNLIKTRIADHLAEQRRREEERVRAQQLLAPAPAAAPAPAPAPAPAAAPPAAKPRMRADGPTDDQVIAVLAQHYRVHEVKVIEWLLRMDLPAASARVCKEFA